MFSKYTRKFLRLIEHTQSCIFAAKERKCSLFGTHVQSLLMALNYQCKGNLKRNEMVHHYLWQTKEKDQKPFSS